MQRQVKMWSLRQARFLLNYNAMDKKKEMMCFLMGVFFIIFVSADSLSFQMRFIVPEEDSTPPTWTNLRNLSGYTNQAFIRYITATDNVAIDCYSLNDTSAFDVNCDGKITNSITLDTATIYYLNLTVNDTSGNINWGEFYINITDVGGGGGVLTCRYKKFGYYDTSLSWYTEANCV